MGLISLIGLIRPMGPMGLMGLMGVIVGNGGLLITNYSLLINEGGVLNSVKFRNFFLLFLDELSIFAIG